MQTNETLTFNPKLLYFLGLGIIGGLSILAAFSINNLNNFKLPALVICGALIVFTLLFLLYNFYSDTLNRLKFLTVEIQDREAFLKNATKKIRKFGYRLSGKHQNIIEYELAYKYTSNGTHKSKIQIFIENNIGVIRGPKLTIDHLAEDLT
jgi:hypothetical protein